MSLRTILASEGLLASDGTFPMKKYNVAHETALKLLGSKMKKAGFKYRRDSQSALFEWTWEKDGNVISLVGWAPKKGWSDRYLFHEVLVRSPSRFFERGWRSPLSLEDGMDEMMPDRLENAYVRSISEAVMAVLEAAKSF